MRWRDPQPSTSAATALTDCSPDPLHFARAGGKAVVADFGGGRLTTEAGALLLREVERHTGLCDALDAALPDPRRPELIGHGQRALLARRITAIARGYEDLNDHHDLRRDPAPQLAAERLPEPDVTSASPATLCRPENRIDRPSLARIAEVLVDRFIARHEIPPESLILDFDATDDPVHGHREGRFFPGDYDHHRYPPLYVSCGDELRAAYLRPSNIDARRHARAVLKLRVRRLRAAGPHVRITLRADSGFCRRRLRRWCDRNGVGYVPGRARNPASERAARDGIERAERQFGRAGPPQRPFGSFASAAGSWDRSRRVIVKAEHTARGPDPRFVVADVPGDPQELSDAVYCRRGEAEDRIKEQQLDLFADRTRCPRFLADRFRLLLSSAAYLLVQALRRTALAGTERAEAQVGTIRLKLRKVAARVVVPARRVVFPLSSSYPYRGQFRRVQDRVMGRPAMAPGAG